MKLAFLNIGYLIYEFLKNEVWTFVSNINDAWDRYENVKSLYIAKLIYQNILSTFDLIPYISSQLYSGLEFFVQLPHHFDG